MEPCQKLIFTKFNQKQQSVITGDNKSFFDYFTEKGAFWLRLYFWSGAAMTPAQRNQFRQRQRGRETALCEMRQCLFVFPPSSNDNWQRQTRRSVGDDLSPIHAKFMFICVAPRQILPLVHPLSIPSPPSVLSNRQGNEYLRMPSITLDRFSRR